LGITLSSIHPQAVVSPQAHLGTEVEIGPLAVVEAGTVIGDGCCLAPHCVIKTGTTLGENNTIGESAIVGGAPQHLRVHDRLGALRIGSGNTIREHVTIHRAMHEGSATVIGDNNLLMVGAHVAHDCKLGSTIVITNGTMLAGHVEVEDRAFLSGLVGVHQFCRIGQLAMIGGHARIKRDVPPFVTVDGDSSTIVGLNVVGLRRAGFTTDQISELKSAYRLIYRQGYTWREVLVALQKEFAEGAATDFYRFMSGGTRGFTPERRTPEGATIKLRVHQDETPLRKAG